MTKKERRRKSAERRIAEREHSKPPPRSRMSAGVISAAGATTAFAWSPFSEFLPVPVKAVGGAIIAAIGAIGAAKALIEEKRKDREGR